MKVKSIIKGYFPITEYSYLKEAGRQLKNDPSQYTFPLTRSVGKLSMIPERILDWWRNAVKESCSRADNATKPKYKEGSYDFITRKVLHTDYTMVVAVVLARKIKVSTEKQAVLLGLLHDVGRFEEVTTGPLRVRVHHGITSKDMLVEEFEQRTIDGELDKIFDIDQMLEAIAQHGYATCNHKNSLATFLRDADKISINSGIEGWIENDKYKFDQRPFWKISKRVRDGFIKNRMVLDENLKSGADNFMKNMSFFYQLVYPESYQYAKKKGIIQNMVDIYDNRVENKDQELTKAVHEALKL